MIHTSYPMRFLLVIVLLWLQTLSLSYAHVADDEPATSPPQSIEDGWEVYVVTEGDSLAYLFRQRNIAPATLMDILRTGNVAQSLKHLKPGQTVRFLHDVNGGLRELVFDKNAVESIHVRAQEDQFTVDLVRKKIETRIASASGTIQSSLFADGRKAGLSENQIMELANMFRWDIDFSLEIRPGDQFRVVFEEQLLDGEKWRNGNILAAEFTQRGKNYQAFRYTNKNGDTAYYNAAGYDKRRAFIRSPLRYTRISSKFSKSRWHPVLKRWRPHKGVDYAAPTGTPIKATGQGRVIFRGTKHGYGRVVILEHASKYQTVYAHMSRFAAKARVGNRVKQGQIIGYVGQTGLATGPHLHYEFRVNGVHRDPLKIKLPRSLRLSGKELARFKRATKPLVTKLATTRPATLIASKSPD